MRHDAVGEARLPDGHHLFGDVGRSDAQEAFELTRERMLDAILIARRRPDGNLLVVRTQLRDRG